MMSFDSCVRLRIGAIAKADYRQGRLMFGSLHRHEAIVATRRYWPPTLVIITTSPAYFFSWCGLRYARFDSTSGVIWATILLAEQLGQRG
jgi:hypothetical protein